MNGEHTKPVEVRSEDLVTALRDARRTLEEMSATSFDGPPAASLYLRAAGEIERLRDALRMIADETVCPDLWKPETRKDWSDGELSHRTALVIANAALEPATKRNAT